MKKNQKGFTLVELLVVVAIIVVLAGVLLLAINPAALLAKGRDARRLEDIEALNKAFALALADGEITLGDVAASTSASPATQAVTGGGPTTLSTGWAKFLVPTGKTGLGKYLAALPVDPLNTGTSVYTFGSTTANYELNLVLESTDNAAKMTTDGGNNAAALEVGTLLTILP